MRQKYHQDFFICVILFFLTTSLLGCLNSCTKKEGAINQPKQKPIRVREGFHLYRETRESISKQWLLSDSLSTYATKEEMKQMATFHQDPIKRLIAFRALLSRNPHEAVDLAISNIEDTTIVATIAVDCVEEDRVSNIRINMLHRHDNEYQVSEEDYARLDSALLFSNNISKFGYSYRLYHDLPAKPENEIRLREIYKQDYWALVALAKYHKENEKQEIIQLLSQAEDKNTWYYRDTLRAALHAVAVWPDDTFIPLVKRECQKILSEKDENGCMEAAFRALFAYHSQWCYDMAEKALAKAKQNEKNYFDVCWSFHEEYEDNPQPLFKPLIKKYPLKYPLENK
jgi:hypothetical protein